MKRLQDKLALVTGAGSGIGKAAALAMAAEGATVGIMDMTAEKVGETVREIRDQGGRAVPLAGDISRPPDVEKAVKTLAGDAGRLDIVFANAGINGVWAPVEELSPEEWNQTMATNLTGTFLTVKYAVPFMKPHGGSIVITSSVNGTRIFSNAGASAYATTKGGQVAFAKMMALELARYRIRVNVICPGAITTSINENTTTRNVEKVKPDIIFPRGEIPLTDGKSGSSEEVADLVLFLAGPESAHISGTEVYIDGAQSLLR